jgi:hypothetical protein
MGSNGSRGQLRQETLQCQQRKEQPAVCAIFQKLLGCMHREDISQCGHPYHGGEIMLGITGVVATCHYSLHATIYNNAMLHNSNGMMDRCLFIT